MVLYACQIVPWWACSRCEQANASQREAFHLVLRGKGKTPPGRCLGGVVKTFNLSQIICGGEDRRRGGVMVLYACQIVPWWACSRCEQAMPRSARLSTLRSAAKEKPRPDDAWAGW